jgi:hypothetical protein
MRLLSVAVKTKEIEYVNRGVDHTNPRRKSPSKSWHRNVEMHGKKVNRLFSEKVYNKQDNKRFIANKSSQSHASCVGRDLL